MTKIGKLVIEARLCRSRAFSKSYGDFGVVSGKEKALLPFPPLRTGREIFTSSGSSLY